MTNLDELQHGVLGNYMVKTDKGSEFSAHLIFCTTGLTLNVDAFASSLRECSLNLVVLLSCAFVIQRWTTEGV